jgi:acetyl/propionyl-CoA carboxylase alpha subunit
MIAARGVVAVRVIRACRDLGFATVAAYDDADMWAPHARLADEAYALPGVGGYADSAALIAIALRAGADAVHPGDGPVALDPDAATAARAHGLTWIGAAQREPARQPGTGPEECAQVDFLAGTAGVVSLGARITAASRRGIPVFAHTAPRETRDELAGRARAVAGELGLQGYGVAEFGRFDGAWRFLGVSVRLTSEHAVAEEQSGVDIVAAQLALAFDAGAALPRVFKDNWAFGFAVEAEDRARGALRAAGVVRSSQLPAGPGVRVDEAVSEGQVIVPSRDNRLAFVTVSARTREQARERLLRAAGEISVRGVTTTAWLPGVDAAADPRFTDASPDTGIVSLEVRGGEPTRIALRR